MLGGGHTGDSGESGLADGTGATHLRPVGAAHQRQPSERSLEKLVGKYTPSSNSRQTSRPARREAREEEERREKTEKGSAKRARLREGGNARDFGREWPTLRDEMRPQRVVEADRRAREEMRLSGVSRI